MSTEKKTRAYDVDGRKVQFDHSAFKNFFRKNYAHLRKDGMTADAYEEDLGKKLCISGSAVHSWLYSVNAPSDVEKVKDLAEALGLSDYMLLLKEPKELTMTITERQKDSLKRIYDAVITFLDRFEKNEWVYFLLERM